MLCTHCLSESVTGPQYVRVTAMRERFAIMTCADCGSTFEAYSTYGLRDGVDLERAA